MGQQLSFKYSLRSVGEEFRVYRRCRDRYIVMLDYVHRRMPANTRRRALHQLSELRIMLDSFYITFCEPISNADEN